MANSLVLKTSGTPNTGMEIDTNPRSYINKTMLYKHIIQYLNEYIEQVEIVSATPKDLDGIVDIAKEVYISVVDSGFDFRNLFLTYTDWNLSKVVKDGDKVVGFYLLSRTPLPKNLSSNTGFDMSRIDNLKGLQGLALGLLPKYQGIGIGNRLINYPKTLGYDYIWGMQYEKLNNLHHWSKRREVIVKGPVNVTIEFITK